ncbi:MAG: protein kinase-like domain protein [Terrestrivirus sp.]|uniref:Protein kinase-like domain protein n=1 Tax=Terrestrivirus sp. TaxID=2487775 RepID=A0A3G4ZK20_9VIRU|nr:MAG: protein kinase-like domain protein [Terrestrivirus sp.]
MNDTKENKIIYSSVYDIDYLNKNSNNNEYYKSLIETINKFKDVVGEDLIILIYSNDQINIKLLMLFEEIGSGGFGKIYKGKLYDKSNINNDGIVVVIKELDTRGNDEMIPQINKEINILNEFKDCDKDIVCTYDHINITNKFYIIMEDLTEKTDLYTYIVNLSTIQQGISLNHLLNIYMKVIDAFINLHRKNIIHRDIKPANIMITTGIYEHDVNFFDENVTIIDFGFACKQDVIIEENNRNGLINDLICVNEKVGTMTYMPPEILRTDLIPDNQNYYQNIDTYSLGVLLHHLIFGNDSIYEFNSLTREFIVIPNKNINSYNELKEEFKYEFIDSNKQYELPTYINNLNNSNNRYVPQNLIQIISLMTKNPTFVSPNKVNNNRISLNDVKKLINDIKLTQMGGSHYYSKYLKYKTKYLNLNKI